MTRINTNISSMVAQNHLSQNNIALQTALTRLSTGLKINAGKDDPAGLIASEALRSDITSINKAVSNTNRAIQILATADSALGQVSNLLNDIRGLIVEAANRGAMSPDEIAANQLQIDSSLEAINRIAQTTTFQGRNLLDGSLDFISDMPTLPPVLDANILQANLGPTGAMNVDVTVEHVATQAELTNTGFAPANAEVNIQFSARSPTVLGDITVVGREDITSDVTITYVHDGSLANNTVQAGFDATTNTVTVRGNEATPGNISKGEVAAAINALPQFSADADPATASNSAGSFTLTGPQPGNSLLTASSINLQADQVGGDFNNIQVVFEAGVSASAAFNSTTKQITVTFVPGATSVANIATQLDGLAEFSVTSTVGGALLSQSVDANIDASTDGTGGEVLLADVVFELGGAGGSETFIFQAGTSNDQIAAAVNLASNATGVTAEVNPTTGDIEFSSVSYGSESFITVNMITEGTGGAFAPNLSDIRNSGADIQARVNGYEATGRGNQFSINTASLTFNMTLDPTVPVTSLNFTISGGGALFQIGGDVVANQQVRLGIQSMSTNRLGGVSGRLYELGSGQDKSLAADIRGAGQVVNEVINLVTTLRGRLGAFQSTTLESNSISLGETLSNLTDAESSIRDTDFAKETAALTRAQILVQSTTQVLTISNQTPQNVLRLLQ